MLLGGAHGYGKQVSSFKEHAEMYTEYIVGCKLVRCCM